MVRRFIGGKTKFWSTAFLLKPWIFFLAAFQNSTTPTSGRLMFSLHAFALKETLNLKGEELLDSASLSFHLAKLNEQMDTDKH